MIVDDLSGVSSSPPSGSRSLPLTSSSCFASGAPGLLSRSKMDAVGQTFRMSAANFLAAGRVVVWGPWPFFGTMTNSRPSLHAGARRDGRLPSWNLMCQPRVTWN